MSSLVVRKILDMISDFLVLLRLVLWPSISSILENVPGTLENVYSAAFGWNVLYVISVESICPNVLFQGQCFLLIFSLDNLCIDISGVLKFPTIVMLLALSPFVSVCFMYLGVLFLGAYVFTVVISCGINLFIKVVLPVLLFISISMEHFFSIPLLSVSSLDLK